MANHWSDEIPVNEDELVDKQEVAAIKRTVARFAAVARDYARKHDTDVTLRTVKAALDIVRDVFTLQPNEAEALQQQVSRAVRSRTALPAGQPQSDSRELQAYSGGQPPAAVQNANAMLQRYVGSLLALNGVEVHLSTSGQLDPTMLQGLFMQAQQNIRDLEGRLADAEQELNRRQLPPPVQQNPHLGQLRPAEPPTGPIPSGDFIPRDEIVEILREIDEGCSYGNGDSSKLGVIHPSRVMGMGNSVDVDVRTKREELVQDALHRLRQLGRSDSDSGERANRRNRAR